MKQLKIYLPVSEERGMSVNGHEVTELGGG